MSFHSQAKEVMKLAYFEDRVSFRIHRELRDRIEKLRALYPGRFETEAQIIRAGIMVLYNKEVDLNGKRRNPDSGFEYC